MTWQYYSFHNYGQKRQVCIYPQHLKQYFHINDLVWPSLCRGQCRQFWVWSSLVEYLVNQLPVPITTSLGLVLWLSFYSSVVTFALLKTWPTTMRLGAQRAHWHAPMKHSGKLFIKSSIFIYPWIMGCYHMLSSHYSPISGVMSFLIIHWSLLFFWWCA